MTSLKYVILLFVGIFLLYNTTEARRQYVLFFNRPRPKFRPRPTYQRPTPSSQSSRNVQPPKLLWYGRFANNLIEITKAITISRQQRASIYIPKHSSSLLSSLTGKTYSYGPNRLPQENKKTYFYKHVDSHELNKTIDQIILPQLKLTPHKSSVLNNSIVIAIRSGDIWNNRLVNRYYIQPPLAFYQAIIEHHSSINDIVIITDQKSTPCPTLYPLINYLKSAGKMVHIMPNATLEKDYSTLVLTSKILVLAAGAWSTTAAQLNYKLTNSIQYFCKFTPEDNPDVMTDQQDPRKRIRTVLVGGPFGKKAYHLNKVFSPQHLVRALYRIPAVIHFPDIIDEYASANKQKNHIPLELAKENEVTSTGEDSQKSN